MDNIEVIQGKENTTTSRFTVVLGSDRHEELKNIAKQQDITLHEALRRVIREGFDS